MNSNELQWNEGQYTFEVKQQNGKFQTYNANIVDIRYCITILLQPKKQ